MQTNSGRHGTLGILWVIYGVICIVRAVWIVLNSATLTLMWGALLNRVANPFFWMSMFHFAMWVVVFLSILTAIFSILAGAALMQSGQSGRSLTLMASFLALLTGPLGIALGVYTLVVVLPQPPGQTPR